WQKPLWCVALARYSVSELLGSLDLQTADRKGVREWSRFFLHVKPIEKYKHFVRIGFAILEGRLPRPCMPAAIFRCHNLHRVAPVREFGRGTFCLAPPQACTGRRRRRAEPDSRKHCFIALLGLDHTEIEDFFLGREKDLVLGPVAAAVDAFSVA